MKRPTAYSALGGIALLVLTGCFRMTPEYRDPDLGFTPPANYQQAALKEDPAAAVQPADRWWEEFGDPQLNQLIEEVLKNNWDIRQAAARVLESRYRYFQVRADQFPPLDVEGGYDRRKAGGGRIDQGLVFDTIDIGVAASYELDLWGRLASASEAARNDILLAEENRRTIAQSIVAETVNLYLQIEALERRLQIADQSVEAFRRSLEFVKIRFDRGLVSALDLRQARRILAGAEARIPQLEQDLGESQQQLAVLLGRYPQTQPPRSQPEDYFQQVATVPPGLPSELLIRRPDVRAAVAQLKALNEQIGVAKARRFPSIALTGSYGYASSELDDLLQYDSNFWNLSLRLFQPLFDAGRLKANQYAAEARYQEQAAIYAQTVLTAFLEVESALLTREKQLERRQRFLKFLDEARATQRVAQNRYIRGLSNYLDVLDAQQTRFEAEDNLTLVDLAVLTSRVDLYRSLGGGWAEPEPVTVKNVGWTIF
ncbi:MAG: transporter [Deltaproteobacteria bacterium SG8_13]|nr:MAG: transporter [Deltaproteobacteria bacterium SG8_13]